MFPRICKPLLSNSFFVFGARGTGKSTLVRNLLEQKRVLNIDLLNPEDEDRFARSPNALISEVKARVADIDWVLIDEVQKLPKLLDCVHLLMTDKITDHILFALTGSSARKLKIVGANLLAGRAFLNELYPLTHLEFSAHFELDKALHWGTLPKIFLLQEEIERKEFLRAYVRNYLKEEVWDERLIQQLDPFRKFLEIAAQSNGTIVNYTKMAKHTGVNDKTIKKYFEVLADTFLGFFLEAYHRSVRAQQISSPKFYLFDPGVKRAMEGMLNVPIMPKTFAYGRAFEHFLLCECDRLNKYLRKDYRLSYLKTKDDLEVDLIVDRPGQPTVLIEIKSTDQIAKEDAGVLRHFLSDFPDAEFRIWSNDLHPMDFDGILALHWMQGIEQLFGTP